MGRIMEWIRQNKQIVAVFGGIAALLVILSLVGRLFGDDPDPFVADTTIATAPDQSTTPVGPSPNSQVPPIDCGDLVTSGEIVEILGVADDQVLGGGSSMVSRNETCHTELGGDSDYFVEISPGGPSDFAVDTVLIGVSGEDVAGVGDEARWFGGPSADDGGRYGVIVVNQVSQHGTIYFRILVGQPVADENSQRDMAVALARLAIPRFPGVEVVVEEIPQEIYVFEDVPVPDQPPVDLTDNLFARIEAGDWSEGEGLVATLRYMAGEVDRLEVLATPDLLDSSASLLIEIARDYLEFGDDASAQAEIARLLDELILSDDELDAFTAQSTGLLVSAVPLAQEADSCVDPSLPDACYDELPIPAIPGVEAGKYSLWADLIRSPEWTVELIAAAKTAIAESARKYEALFDMPEVKVALKPTGDSLYVGWNPGACTVYVGEALSGGDSLEFRQLLAREIAFCLIAEKFVATIEASGGSRAGPAASKWWVNGLANYLSGYVFPSINIEHKELPQRLAQTELSTVLGDRTWTNWLLFEYLHGFGGAEGNLALIESLPVGGDPFAALAETDGFPEHFHGFARSLTDANIADQGPGFVPYEPRSWDLFINSPVKADVFGVPFGVQRIFIQVGAGLTACVETLEEGELLASWRTGVPGEPGSWDDVAPVELEGESMLVVTSVKPGGKLTIDIGDVSDDSDCTDEEDPTPTTLGDCGLCPPSQYFYD